MVRYRARLPPPPSPPPGSTVEIVPVPAGGRVSFARQNVQPPGDLYVAQNDQLLVLTQAASGGISSIEFRGRLLRPNGEIVPLAYSVTPGLAPVAFVFPLADGFLLTLAAFGPFQSIVPYLCYVHASIARGPLSGLEVYQVLFSGHVTQNRPLSWPGGPHDQSEAGPGNVRIVGIANPAAGADWTFTIPDGAVQEIISLRAFYAASAGVGNRTPFLNIDNGGGATLVAHIPPQATLVANQQTSITWARGLPYSALGTGTMVCPFPTDTKLRAGQRVFAQTTGIDPADQWSAINFLVREWPSWHS